MMNYKNDGNNQSLSGSKYILTNIEKSDIKKYENNKKASGFRIYKKMD